jgi:hypothetical protein
MELGQKFLRAQGRYQEALKQHYEASDGLDEAFGENHRHALRCTEEYFLLVAEMRGRGIEVQTQSSEIVCT